MYIHHHLGLGDHIICNGLVRGLLGTEAEIVLATEASCEEAVRHLYADTNVKLHLVSGDQQAEEEYRKHDSVLRVGFENCHIAGMPCRPDWEKAFYDYVEMPYEKRYELFHFPRSEEREQELLEKLDLPDEFAFVNTATSKGSFDIEIDTQLPIVRLTRVEGITLLDWVVVLEKATEIHTVDTSVFQLAKQYKFDKRKVFYDVRTGRGDGTPFTFEDEGWEINARTN
jgi:hypothetical protein